MAAGDIVSAPPLRPGRQSGKATLAPPRPPSLPGAKPLPSSVVAPPRAPGAPKIQTSPRLPGTVPRAAPKSPDSARAAEIDRRRTAMTGTGVVGDPPNTFELLKTGAKNTLKTIPMLIKKYWWLVLIIGGLWILCQSFSVEAYTRMVPSMHGFWVAIKPTIDFLVFLTAAYNNWFAKTVYGLIILKLLVPFIQRIRTEGFKPVTATFKSVPPGIKNSWKESGAWAMTLFIAASGVGAIMTNFLSGNNSYTRCIASVALALSFVKILADGKTGLPFLSSRVVSKDVFRLFKKNTPVKNYHVYLCLTGIMTGLATSIIFALIIFNQGFPGVFEFAGYWIGLVAIAAGVVLYFVQIRGKQTAKAVETAK